MNAAGEPKKGGVVFDIEEELKKLPMCPGVYLHKDSLGNVIYVGKAVKLRNRVSQYFHNTQHSPKVRAMVGVIKEFDYITCQSEMEALILECNLIKKYMPKYNVLLKDGKTYPYIEVTVTEPYPRVIRTREVKRDGNKYFGPYSDSGAVSRMIELIHEMYPIKKCRTVRFPKGTRPCLNYHIGRCKGVCIGAADKKEYDEMIEAILSVLSGHDAALKKSLKAKMEKASEELRFEDAARYRDDLRAFDQLGETQRATMATERDIDVLLPIRTGKTEIVAQYKVRDGRLVGREVHYLNDVEGSEPQDLVSAFLMQYYTGSMRLPKEILLREHIDEEQLLEDLLNRTNEENARAKHDIYHKTKILVPERGEKKAMLDLAVNDSLQLVRTIDERAQHEEERKTALREKLEAVIRRASSIDHAEPYLIEEGEDREYRIEAYDISNMNGLDTVGAMVVYEGRKPIRSDYRKFRIRSEEASGDDYASLQEVIYRRFKRAKDGDPGFSKYPDLLFIDGGLGQVHAVKQVMDAMRVTIPVVGLAKDDFHRTRAIVYADGSEQVLKGDPILFAYTGTVQEEVHRFAITFQRGVRGVRVTHSVLEEIPGIGPKRRKELLRHFRSMEAIRKASYEELLACDGMNARAAEAVLQYFAERAGGQEKTE